MKRAIGLALMVMAAGSVSTAARADEGSWLVRARAVRLHMADQSEAIPSLGVPSDAIQANDKTIPEIDITYFFTKNIAAELILTVPQKQDVTLSGAKIGTRISTIEINPFAAATSAQRQGQEAAQGTQERPCRALRHRAGLRRRPGPLAGRPPRQCAARVILQSP